MALVISNVGAERTVCTRILSPVSNQPNRACQRVFLPSHAFRLPLAGPGNCKLSLRASEISQSNARSFFSKLQFNFVASSSRLCREARSEIARTLAYALFTSFGILSL